MTGSWYVVHGCLYLYDFMLHVQPCLYSQVIGFGWIESALFVLNDNNNNEILVNQAKRRITAAAIDHHHAPRYSPLRTILSMAKHYGGVHAVPDSKIQDPSLVGITKVVDCMQSSSQSLN